MSAFLNRCRRPAESRSGPASFGSPSIAFPRIIPASSVAAPPDTLQTSTPHFRFSEGNAGRVLYRNYCASCHSLDGLKLVGPTFVGLVGSTRKVRDAETGKTQEVRADAKYLKQSILEPNAQLLDGYPANLMPPVGASLTEKQINDADQLRHEGVRSGVREKGSCRTDRPSIWRGS